MGIFSRIKQAVTSTYEKVDTKVGGYLPGSVTPTQVKQKTQTVVLPPVQVKPTPTTPTPSPKPSPTSTPTPSRSKKKKRREPSPTPQQSLSKLQQLGLGGGGSTPVSQGPKTPTQTYNEKLAKSQGVQPPTPMEQSQARALQNQQNISQQQALAQVKAAGLGGGGSTPVNQTKQSLYQRADVAVGGVLPGGPKPSEVKFEETIPGRIVQASRDAQAKSKIATQKDIEKYQKFQQKVSDKIPTMEEVAEPISDYISDKHTFTQAEIDKLAKVEKVIRPFGEAGEQIYEGIREKPVTTAVTAASFYALPAVLAGVGAGARATGGAAIVAKLPGTTKALGTAVKVGLPIYYGSSVAKRIHEADNVDLAWDNYKKDLETTPVPEGYRELSRAEFVLDYNDNKISKAGMAGRIYGTEIIPMVVGGYYGVKHGGKITDLFRVKGRTIIPETKVIETDVLTGKTRFPEKTGLGIQAKQKYDIKLFESQKHALPIEKLKGYTGKGELVYSETFKKLPFKVKPSGYHATEPQFWKKGEGIEVHTKVKRKTDFPGLYTAPSISKHFLRGNGEKVSLFGGKIFDPFGKPSIASVQPTKFVKGTKGKLGEAYIPGTKAEVEALIVGKTNLEFLGGKYYTKIGGRSIPIDQFRATTKIPSVGKKVKVTSKNKDLFKKVTKPETKKVDLKVGDIISRKQLKSSYVKPRSTPLLSTTSLALGSTLSAISSKRYTPPSKPITGFSRSTINTPESYTPPSRISSTTSTKPSYTPPSSTTSRPISSSTSAPSSTPPSKPSYTLDYTPSSSTYTPSYTPSSSSIRRPTGSSSYTPSSTSRRVPLVPFFQRRTISEPRKKPADKGLFQAHIRKDNKWRAYGARGPKKQVITKTKEHLEHTLRASMRVKNIRKDRYVPLTPTPRFRHPKKNGDNTILIEKRNLRLSTRGEVSDIHAKRRRTPTKKKRRKKK